MQTLGFAKAKSERENKTAKQTRGRLDMLSRELTADSSYGQWQHRMDTVMSAASIGYFARFSQEPSHAAASEEKWENCAIDRRSTSKKKMLSYTAFPCQVTLCHQSMETGVHDEIR